MAGQRFSTPILVRQELEETWRKRLEQSHNRYHRATTDYRKLLQQEPDGRPPGADSALARARQEETDALMEYSGLLHVFTDLTIHGKLPDEGSADLLEPGPGKDEVVISIIDDDKSLRDS